MTKVRFTRDYTTKEATPQSFKEGEEVDFMEVYAEDAPAGANEPDAERQRRARAEASAEHFVKRGVAERVEEGGEEKKMRGRKAPPPKEDRPKEGEAPKGPDGGPRQAPEQPAGAPARAEVKHGKGVEPHRAPIK